MQEIFDAIPLSEAMPDLCSKRPNSKGLAIACRLAKEALPAVAAGLWLYVDDLERSHRISQAMHDATGAYWHAIMHRREGDFWNSGYWLRQCGRHPAMDWYDPHEFSMRVERERRSNPAELVEMQRKEWKMLFDWCLSNSGG